LKKVFITGASGCIGHYVIDLFINDNNYELYLLARDPKKFKFDYKNNERVNVCVGNLDKVEEHQKVIEVVDYVIHIATDWSDSDYATLLNLEKTHWIFENARSAKKIIYFSTASILGKGNKPIIEAELYGSGYVKSKYLAYQHLQKMAYKDKVITVFPTLVFGGDSNHPYSHITSGIKPNLHYLKLLRFFYMDSGFHFLHSKDIALVVKYLLENKTEKNEYVLGTPSVTGKEAIALICRIFEIRMFFRFKITAKFLFFLAKILKIYVDPWSKFCIESPFFLYDVVDPKKFGIECFFPSLEALLLDIKGQ
jgi:nucleoside-diphosphate-sugar epimerase